MSNIVPGTNGHDSLPLPYARLESPHFGVYEIWQEKTVVGRKNNRREVDVDMGSSSLISRVHFEILLLAGTDYQLKCLSKNGLFINSKYVRAAGASILPKQCVLRFPSTDICISFSSSSNTTGSSSQPLSTETIQASLPASLALPSDIASSSLLVQSLPNLILQQQHQQVILVTTNQSNQHQPTDNLLPLCTNIASALASDQTIGSFKTQYENLITGPRTGQPHSLLNSSLSPSCSTSPKHINNDLQDTHAFVSSPVVQRLPTSGIEFNASEVDASHAKHDTKPPFSYAQLIVQAILSAPDQQMTLSQIYSFITAQYPYYEANNRGWQNSIRHNLSLNRYFVRLARKDNESGKGSFWRLDHTCEEKLIDHAFRHRKQRAHAVTLNSSANELDHNTFDDNHSPLPQYANDPTDFLLADIHTNSNPSTPLSPMTSPLVGPLIEAISPARTTDDHKRKCDDDDLEREEQVEELLRHLIASVNEHAKRQRTLS